MSHYNHIVEVNEDRRTLTIYRITETDKQLYTSVQIPNISWSENPDAIKEFCRYLGENLIIDSPTARRLLGL